MDSSDDEVSSFRINILGTVRKAAPGFLPNDAAITGSGCVGLIKAISIP